MIGMPNSGMATSHCYYLDGQRGRWGERTEWYKNMQFGEEKCTSEWSSRQNTWRKTKSNWEGVKNHETEISCSPPRLGKVPRGETVLAAACEIIRESLKWECHGRVSLLENNCLEKFLRRLCLQDTQRQPSSVVKAGNATSWGGRTCQHHSYSRYFIEIRHLKVMGP